MRVLLVDDNEELRGFLALALAENDVDCVATDTQGALKCIETEKFDALIVDSFLDSVDGISLVKQIRASRNGRNIPVLLMSPVGTGLARRMAKDAGCNEFLVKPFGPLQFAEQVKNMQR